MERCPPAKAKVIQHKWLATQKDKLEHSIWHYWLIRNKLTMIDGIVMKGKGIIVFFSVTKTDSADVAQYHHGHREDKAPGT